MAGVEGPEADGRAPLPPFGEGAQDRTVRDQLRETTEVLRDPSGRTVVGRFVTTVDGTLAAGRRMRVEAEGCDATLVGVVEARTRPGGRRAELTLHVAPRWSTTDLAARLIARLAAVAAAEGVRRLCAWAPGPSPLVDALPLRHQCRPDGGGVAVDFDLAS
jgi:hypothetical protein